MQVRQVAFHEFMSYTGSPVIVPLPPVGLVLVTGVNGAGKSTIAEAVSYAGWNKTLRGTDPRREGVAGHVFLEAGGGMEITRHWKEGMRNVLDVEVQGHTDRLNAFAFDTPTKAQEYVAGVLGEWDTWRRSCAFSSRDELSFAMATDAERKRLLESLLGLTRFDRALDACRGDLREANSAAELARMELIRAVSARETAVQSLVALEAAVHGYVPDENMGALRLRLQIVRDGLPGRIEQMQQEQRVSDATVAARATFESRVREMQRQIRDLTQGDNCTMCGQPWPDKEEKERKRIGLTYDLEQFMLDPPPGPDKTKYRLVEEALRDSRSAIATLEAKMAAAEAAERRHKEAQDLVANAKLRIMDLEDAETTARAGADAHGTSIRHLSVTDTVLGTKGARAHMLSDALVGLEAVANLWLEKIARVDAPLRLRLSPYTEKKTGGTSDSISMEVEGAGGGRGYKGASGGERRRIDVAIMLALAEVAQQADHRVCPTMFFDEVFDSLDPPGVEAVSGALDQLAQDRCVVVMSHSVDVINTFVADLHLHVLDGKIEHK